jgi:hypothetical protein
MRWAPLFSHVCRLLTNAAWLGSLTGWELMTCRIRPRFCCARRSVVAASAMIFTAAARSSFVPPAVALRTPRSSICPRWTAPKLKLPSAAL